MSSSLIKEKKKGPSKIQLGLLNSQQQMFVQSVLADPSFNLCNAAKAAGYKFPSQAVGKLMSNTIVMKAIGHAIQVRSKKLGLKAEDVLEHLSNALFLDPIKIFQQSKDGELEIRPIKRIPKYVRRCITKLKRKDLKNREGIVYATEYDIEFMSKDTAAGLVMQHLGLLGKGAVGVNINVDAQLINRLLNEAEARNNVVDSNVVEGEVLNLPSPKGAK